MIKTIKPLHNAPRWMQGTLNAPLYECRQCKMSAKDKRNVVKTTS